MAQEDLQIIVDRWCESERLSLEKLPRPGQLYSGGDIVCSVGESALCPWQAGHPLALRPKSRFTTFRHIVYIGVYSRDAALASLEWFSDHHRIPATTPNRIVHGITVDGSARSDDQFVSRSLGIIHDDGGECALASIEVSETGYPKWDTFSISPALWLLGLLVRRNSCPVDLLTIPGEASNTDVFGSHLRMKNRGDYKWLTHKGYTYKELVEQIAAKCTRMYTGVVTASTLAQMAEFIESEIATGLPVHSPSYVLTQSLDSESSLDPAPQVASRTLRELERVSEALQFNDVGPALRHFLGTAVRQPERFSNGDSRQESFANFLAPSLLPLAAWPGVDGAALVLSQQMAVNYLLAPVGSCEGAAPNRGYLRSITTPHGTGRTTVLRDVLAALTLQRARALAVFDDPRDAFSSGDLLGDGSTGFDLDPSLYGHEVLLVSDSDSAARQLSQQLNLCEHISTDAHHTLDVRDAALESLLSGPHWGAFCMPLDCEGRNLTSYLHSWVVEQAKEMDLRDRSDDSHTSNDEWQKARARFQRAATIAENLASFPISAAKHLGIIRRASAGIRELLSELKQRSLSLEEGAQRERMLRARHRDLVDSGERARIAYRQIAQNPPTIRRIVVSLGTEIGEWRARCKLFAADIVDRDEALKGSESELLQYLTWQNEERATIMALRERVVALRRELADATDAFDNAKGEADYLLFDDDLSKRSRSEREQSTVWISDEFCRARQELFLAAYHLQRAFVRVTDRQLRANLASLRNLMLRDRVNSLESGSPSDSRSTVSRRARSSLLASLSIVFPCLSASCDAASALLCGFGREAIGTVVLDGAERIAAKDAVGILWRSRKVVTTGDEAVAPLHVQLQLSSRSETTSVAPEKTVLGQTHFTSPSVQAIADSASQIGTGVGGPMLTVRWGYAEPVFSLLNKLTRSEFVSGSKRGRHNQTIKQSVDPMSRAPRSAWYDVRSSIVDQNALQGSEEIVEALLDALAELRFLVQIVSPFPEVVSALRRRFVDFDIFHQIGAANDMLFHEQRIVIFVLGGGTLRLAADRADFARDATPIIQVLSAAKGRLYVVGDHRIWSFQRYTAELGRFLPVKVVTESVVMHHPQRRPIAIAAPTEDLAAEIPHDPWTSKSMNG